MKKIILTEKAPAPVGPYSQAIQCGDFLFCSGQIPINPQTGEVFTGDIQRQTEIVMENIKAVLEKAELNFSNIIKTTVYLTSMSDFAKVNEIYARYFPQNPPARSCVAVKELPKNVNVEVEVLAHR